MRITKIDPYAVEQQKNKNRLSSTSHQKALAISTKKKQISSLLSNQHILNNKNYDINQKQQQLQNNLNNQFKVQNSPLTHSKKALTNQLMFKDKKQSFLDFIQAQIRSQNKQQTKPNILKNKVKLPLISTNKTVTLNNLAQEEDKTYIQNQRNISAKQIPHSSNSNYEKNDLKQIDIGKGKQNPIFINIKAVIPLQKTSVHRKKDHSLRDLRLIRKEKQQNDFILQDPNAKEQYPRTKHNTVLLKKNQLTSKQSSPLKLTTGDKKNSKRNSFQKINLKDKRSFSIKQNKKKYATNYNDFCNFISSLNKIRISQPPLVLYKAFVGKGNNSILVKNAIKNRFWWNIMTQKIDEDVNFLWLQSRDNNFISSLNCINAEEKKIINTQKESKKQKYHLQNKNQQKSNQNIRQFIHQGFTKLLSQKQVKENNFTPFFAQATQSQFLNVSLDPNKIRIHNHLQFNWNLTNKKALFYNLKTYYELVNQNPFKYIPLTYHVKKHGDQSWNQFKIAYDQRLNQNNNLKDANKDATKKKKKDKKQKGSNPLWIIKPGENSNQGCGIQVSDSIQQIAQMVKTKTQTQKNRSSIIQRYLMPFLYNKRKFDIRCYMVATSIKGVLKGYWYQQGYIRTSSKQFTTKNLKNRMIHLTNDAVQKKGEDYGKYQNGNKVSFADFQKYLDNNYAEKKLNFYKTVYPQMMRLARDALTATYQVLDSKNRQFTFQVFGLDFMIDEQFNTWLIEVNNNPCLQLSSPLLARIIPNMIQNAFKIVIDPLFPPPLSIPKTKTLATQLFESNKYTLIFNSGDISQGFKHTISQNKVNLDKIIQGQQENDQIDDQQCDNTHSQNLIHKENQLQSSVTQKVQYLINNNERQSDKNNQLQSSKTTQLQQFKDFDQSDHLNQKTEVKQKSILSRQESQVHPMILGQNNSNLVSQQQQ